MLCEMVKVSQQRFYDGLIAELKEEQKQLEEVGDWEAAGILEKRIAEFQKKREELQCI